MPLDGRGERNHNPHDWSSSSHSKEVEEAKADGNEPLALHNFRTASVSHREHATGTDTLTSDDTLTKTSSHLQNTRQVLGLHPTAPIVEEHDTREESDLWWPRVRLTLKEPFAEFFGVFIMV